ncbi:MAG: hypothetical protein D6746_06350 [Bacteroidetes bacterium]|nr:MAG: hypothetical protein D6746_06350 [Bacteroidota bacterium]
MNSVFRRWLWLWMAALLAPPALAQNGVLHTVAGESGGVYYTIVPRATVYTAPDSGRPYVELRFREPVTVLEEVGRWRRVRTRDGARGYVEAAALSNVWIRVSKRKQTVYVYRGGERIRAYPADLGQNFFADKVQRGSLADPDHWRTPDGVFFVVKKNPHSKFHRALVLNYPSAEDAERGLREGLITRAQYEAIVRAEREYRMPPMNTALGGWIEIHGDGTGARSNWTQGCVALHNRHIDELWNWVSVGTPVLIEP